MFKGECFKNSKTKYQISKIAGIGDSYNDLTMLEKADISFTFKNSPVKLKEQVDYQVDSVSEAIEIFLK